MDMTNLLPPSRSPARFQPRLFSSHSLVFSCSFPNNWDISSPGPPPPLGIVNSSPTSSVRLGLHVQSPAFLPLAIRRFAQSHKTQHHYKLASLLVLRLPKSFHFAWSTPVFALAKSRRVENAPYNGQNMVNGHPTRPGYTASKTCSLCPYTQPQPPTPSEL